MINVENTRWSLVDNTFLDDIHVEFLRLFCIFILIFHSVVFEIYE